MNGFDNITARLEADALSALSALDPETEEKLRAIHEQYESRAEREREEGARLSAQIADERLARLRSAARMEEKKLLLRAKQEVVGEAFSAALDKLCSLPQEKYIAVLEKFITESILTEREEVILNASDRETVGARIVEEVNKAQGVHLTLSEDTEKMRAGFLLRDGDREVNGDFAVLLRLSRTKLEREAAARLFPE